VRVWLAISPPMAVNFDLLHHIKQLANLSPSAEL